MEDCLAYKDTRPSKGVSDGLRQLVLCSQRDLSVKLLEVRLSCLPMPVETIGILVSSDVGSSEAGWEIDFFRVTLTCGNCMVDSLWNCSV